MKIYHNEALIAEYNANGTRRTRYQRAKIAARRLLINARNVSLVALVLAATYGLGALTSPITTYATIEKLVPDATIPPVMQRIAKCESGNTHLDPKTHQVLIRTNNNRTYDTGKYQINSIHNAEASRLGFNLTVEADNEAFAMYLYKNYGTQPWEASRPNCWNK